MEKKNSFSRVGSLRIFWGFLAILLCVAPCVWAVTFDDGQEYDIDYQILNDFLQVDNATVNLLPGAYVQWYVTANAGSTVNIRGGQVEFWISVMPGSNVTVYGTYFKFGGVEHYAGEEMFITLGGGPLTVVYEDGTQVDLPIDCYYEVGEGGVIINNTTITLAAPGVGGPIEVDIDIKPGSDTNPINPRSNGLIPVAILTTNDFDAADVDPATVTLAGASVAVRGKAEKLMAHLEDVDGDDDLDLLVQVETQSDGVVWETGPVTLQGKTYGGQDIEGTDYVVIVPPKSSNKDRLRKSGGLLRKRGHRLKIIAS